jgi:hypothetical protein
MRRIVILSAARDLLFVAGALAVATDLVAQKPVLLQLRPRIGDTVWMRLDQQTELANRRADMKAPSPALLSTTTVTYSRAVAESGVAASTTIVAITDSVFVTNGEQAAKGIAPMNQKHLQGQRARFEIAPDGSLSIPPDTPPQKGEKATPSPRSASLIPATFPNKPVSVGDKWMRAAPLPAGSSQLGASIVGWVEATFRLDSLTRNGELAWVSIDGNLKPDPAGAKMNGVTTVDDGTVDGYMVLDRNRGWLVESQFTIVAHSTLQQPFGVPGQPVRFEIRLIQSLRALR